MPDAERSTLLDLPYILPDQAQKHITHNEALLRLDGIVQASVLSSAQPEPPATAQDGDRYIVAPSATGAANPWAGQDGAIAMMTGAVWTFLVPQDGWLCFDREGDALLVHRGGAWTPLSTGGSDRVERLGIATQADDATRLAVLASGSLLTHDGTDHRLTIDRAASADTASVVWSTQFVGNAELGLAGEDALIAKVSVDGTAWQEALRIDVPTGRVSVGGVAGTAAFNVSRTFRVVHPTASGALDVAFDGQSAYFTNYASGGTLSFSQVGDGEMTFWVGGAPRLRVRADRTQLEGPLKLPVLDRTGLPAAGDGSVLCVRQSNGTLCLAVCDGGTWSRADGVSLA